VDCHSGWLLPDDRQLKASLQIPNGPVPVGTGSGNCSLCGRLASGRAPAPSQAIDQLRQPLLVAFQAADFALAADLSDTS
jgi:hypothetical protein